MATKRTYFPNYTGPNISPSGKNPLHQLLRGEHIARVYHHEFALLLRLLIGVLSAQVRGHARRPVAHHRHVEMLHQLLGDAVRGADDHFIDTAICQDREGPLVDVHDGIIEALVSKHINQ
jgi:hypothetical protein